MIITTKMVELMMKTENPNMYQELQKKGQLKKIVSRMTKMAEDNRQTIEDKLTLQRIEEMKGKDDYWARVQMYNQAIDQATEIALAQLRESLQPQETSE